MGSSDDEPMRLVFDFASLVRDAWVGKCVACGDTSRRFACAACTMSAPLEWQLADVPAWSAAPYGGLVGERIRRLKYAEETHWAGPLGRLLHARMSQRVLPHVMTPDTVLVPVPLHPARLAERGFNQSALVARAFARKSGLRVRTDVLKRLRQTKAQATLDARARHENMAAAFEVDCAPGAPLVLVDDVATTGSTLVECILCLARAGAIVRGVMTVALAGEMHITPHQVPPSPWAPPSL